MATRESAHQTARRSSSSSANGICFASLRETRRKPCAIVRKRESTPAKYNSHAGVLLAVQHCCVCYANVAILLLRRSTFCGCFCVYVRALKDFQNPDTSSSDARTIVWYTEPAHEMYFRSSWRMTCCVTYRANGSKEDREYFCRVSSAAAQSLH